MINTALKIQNISSTKFGKHKQKHSYKNLEEIANDEVSETLNEISYGRTALLNGLHRLETNLPEEQRDILRTLVIRIDETICSLVRERREMLKTYTKEHIRTISYRKTNLTAANEA